ncbi:hypothetical protein FACS1894164_18910 [Spirochaetia bacterium]|nr:hypothetical protein FACS1894164_18910 [Spirochaetia bacterium]
MGTYLENPVSVPNPAYMAAVPDILGGIANAGLPGYDYPETSSINYAQAGIRFTTTIGTADVGAQYYYGLLPRPTVVLSGVTDFWANIDWTNPLSPVIGEITPHIAYNRFHQIGIDYAQIIAGFNIRAEVAGNFTNDFSGDDGTVYNPSIAWSLGFDHGLPLGITVNVQATESIRLFHNKIDGNPVFDTEAGTKMTSTRLTFNVSKNFLRDTLETNITGIWGIEDKDFLIMPGIVWTKGDISLELIGGIFGGDKAGELGQYHKNSFIKAGLTYSF